MKILHTPDWHLGQNFMGKSRFEEHKAFFYWLLNLIKEQEIDVLLVSGDIFDTGTPPNYALELYYNFLKELSHISTLKSTVIRTVEALKERIPLQIKVEPKGDRTSELELS